MWVRTLVCIAFLISLYGGMFLLTAAMLVKGFVIVGVISGLVLAAMIGMALALAGLAWSMADLGESEDAAGMLQVPG